MNSVNKTLYIPLYGKAYVSRKGMILQDKKAEEIWSEVGFPLKGKSKSKWLAYYMGMRAYAFDAWLKDALQKDKEAIVIQIGCGMDSRILRVNNGEHLWFDVDFPEVIAERKRFYQETENYHMIEADAQDKAWLKDLPKAEKVIVVMEGVSMYFEPEKLKGLLEGFTTYFGSVALLVDCYTDFAAKASKYKNPINDVGVTIVHGVDEPKNLAEGTGLMFVKEHEMTPKHLIEQLDGVEKKIFTRIFAGKFAKRMYRLYEYRNV